MKKFLTVFKAAALVFVMLLAGTTVFAANTGDAGQQADIPIIEAKVASSAYPAITVEVGKPVSINFKVDAADLNACNNEILIPAFNIDKKLAVGDNMITFTPTETGVFAYSCWMNMIQSTITVVEQDQGQIGAAEPAASAVSRSCPMYSSGYNSAGGSAGGGVGGTRGGCCGGGRW